MAISVYCDGGPELLDGQGSCRSNEAKWLRLEEETMSWHPTYKFRHKVAEKICNNNLRPIRFRFVLMETGYLAAFMTTSLCRDAPV